MDLNGLSVAVVGGGIGGVAAAAALAQRGATVTLHEQADAFGEVGAGLQVSANGQRVLRALGAVGDSAPDGATRSPGTVFRDGRTGKPVALLAAPKAGPTWYMHRADLLDLLVTCAEKAGVEFSFGRIVGPGAVSADVVIAADGVRSLWRSGIDGPVAPSFTGQVAWRALVPWEQEADLRAWLTMRHRAHVVSYPLRGSSLINLVAVEERTGWTEDSWSQMGDPAEFRDRFSDFGGALRSVIERVENVHQWALHARPVARTWVKGNVAVLGDAAHPTLPFMAQGACMALEDAWVLADALSQADDITGGLQRYQRLRHARAEKIVGLAAGNASRFHMGWPFNWGAYATLALGAGILARRLEWVYEYDAVTLS